VSGTAGRGQAAGGGGRRLGGLAADKLARQGLVEPEAAAVRWAGRAGWECGVLASSRDDPAGAAGLWDGESPGRLGASIPGLRGPAGLRIAASQGSNDPTPIEGRG
jgi:hypothetical protein